MTRRRAAPGDVPPAWSAMVGLAALALYPFLAPTARLAAGTVVLVRAAWQQVPFQRGVIFWSNDMYTRLRAYQLLDGEKPDLYVENPGVLTWPAGRAEFQKRFGFDPLEGGALRGDADLARVADNVGQRTRLPVADCDELLRVAAERTGIRPQAGRPPERPPDRPNRRQPVETVAPGRPARP